MVIKSLQASGCEINLVVGPVYTGQSLSLALELGTGRILSFQPMPRIPRTPQEAEQMRLEHVLDSMSMQSRALGSSISGKESARVIRR